MNCPKCSHTVPDIARFCQNCGYQIGRSTPASAASSPPPLQSRRQRVVKSSGSQWAVIVGSLGIVALIGGGFLVLWLSHGARTNRLEAAARVTSGVTPRPPDGSGSRSQNSFTPGEIPPSPGSGAAVDTRPFPLNNPRPNYTEDARRNKVQGVIRTRALVGPDGLVKDVRLVTHLPDGLDEEAIVAVKQMRFRPATRNGQPVDFWVTLEVEFSLR